ncbi:MAG: DUF4430 domain-containing protein, partial [Oscillospiraceae bacterium]|nr:DUF4430 domain-containing protein [Oscillospiraceae bacterium]
HENPESAAQVWIALAALDISPLTDARFVRNGRTLLDAIRQFSRGDGQYAHLADGPVNAAATQQVFLALTAEQCRQAGRYFYLPDGFRAKTQPAVTAPTTVRTDASQTVPQTRTTPDRTADARTSGTANQTETTSRAAETTSRTVSDTDERTDMTAADSASFGTTSASAAAGVTSGQTQSGTGAAQIVPKGTSAGRRYPYRIPMTVGIAVIFTGFAVFFLIRGNRSAKTYLTMLGICGALTAGVWLIRVELPDSYYQPQTRSGGGTVTMEIRCDVICGMAGSERFPADGILLPETAFEIDENENALTLLYDAVRAYSMQIEVDGVSGDVVETAYVRGIASLYEFDFGDLSGWTYLVNGERPSVGCGAYTLHDGDQVVWAYTVSL